MSAGITIRPELPGDAEPIRAVNLGAFRSRAEADLVDRLRASDAFIPGLSLVAVRAGDVVGHLLLTRAEVVPLNPLARDPLSLVALGPMGVVPPVQRRGIGSTLVRHALAAAADAGHHLVVVLGHPGYYPRFGFERASRYAVRCPFDAPDDAFMVHWLDTPPRALHATTLYPNPFSELASG